jgi:hypothetical protein
MGNMLPEAAEFVPAKVRKVFFFEKKKQKTFAPAP